MGMMMWVGVMMIALLPELDGGLQVAVFLTVPLCFGLPAYLVYRVLRTPLAEQKVGQVDIGLSDERVAPGEQITSTVTLEPDGSVHLDELTIRLHGYEEVVGRDRRVPGDDGSPQMAIPDQPLYSFDADDNNVNWELNVHVDVPSWPDWNHTEPMLVRPQSGAEETGPGGDAEAADEADNEEEYAVTW